MNTNIFTSDFFKSVYKEICDYCVKNYESNDEPTDTMRGQISFGDYEVEFEADITNELVDDCLDTYEGIKSFGCVSHDFGHVSAITELKIYDEDGLVEGVNADTLNDCLRKAA